jgi:hypothetical protein
MKKRSSWTCPKCGRIFTKTKQPHSCQKVALRSHFKGKPQAKKLFDHLVRQINQKIGPSQVISIPCCVHLFGHYDFLAALPKRKGLEIRLALNRQLKTKRLKQSVPLSSKAYKNCFLLTSTKEIDQEFISWIKESYHLRD